MTFTLPPYRTHTFTVTPLLYVHADTHYWLIYRLPSDLTVPRCCVLYGYSCPPRRVHTTVVTFPCRLLPFPSVTHFTVGRSTPPHNRYGFYIVILNTYPVVRGLLLRLLPAFIHFPNAFYCLHPGSPAPFTFTRFLPVVFGRYRLLYVVDYSGFPRLQHPQPVPQQHT